MCGLAKDSWQTGEQESNQGKSELRPQCRDLEKAERRGHGGGAEQDLLRGEKCSLNKCLSREKCKIRVLGSNLDYLVSICLWLASVSCKVGQGTEQGTWTFGQHTSESSHSSPSKLSQLNVLKTIAHKSWQEHHPAFLSISPSPAEPSAPGMLSGNSPRAGWAEEPLCSLPQERWTRISCCLLAARAQAVLQGSWIALLMSVWKYSPKVCSCIQTVVGHLSAKLAPLRKELLLF